MALLSPRAARHLAWRLEDDVRDGRRVDVAALMPLATSRSAEARAISAALLPAAMGSVRVRRRCLTRLFSDRAELVRIAALEGTSTMADPLLFATAARCVEDDSPLVRAYAAQTVLRLDRHRAIRLVRHRLARERSSLARVGLLGVLIDGGDRAALAPLVDLLQSRQYRVRCACASVLSQVARTPAAVTVARAALREARRNETTVAGRRSLNAALRSLRVG